MTIAEDLKQSVKALVCHEMDIVHEGDWFKDFVKDIVDERLNEIQDSEKDSDDLQKDMESRSRYWVEFIDYEGAKGFVHKSIYLYGESVEQIKEIMDEYEIVVIDNTETSEEPYWGSNVEPHIVKVKTKNAGKYFLVRWGEGYSTSAPRVYEMKEFLDDDFWNLPSDFIDDLKSSLPSDKLKFTDLSGDVYFECIDNS